MKHIHTADTQHTTKPNAGPAASVIPTVQHKLEIGSMANKHDKILHSGPDQRIWYGVDGGLMANTAASTKTIPGIGIRGFVDGFQFINSFYQTPCFVPRTET